VAATDYIKLLIDRAWALLEAHTPWTDAVKVGNRIKFDTKAGGRVGGLPNDFPRAAIFIAALNDSLFTLEQTYQHRSTFNVNTMAWTEDLMIALRVLLVFKDQRIASATPLAMETLTALRKGGPALGLAITGGNIMRVGPAQFTFSNTTAADDATVDSNVVEPHLSANVDLPILLRLKGNQLIT
jgi:hypothetical protein